MNKQKYLISDSYMGQTYKLVETLDEAILLKENSLKPALYHVYEINRINDNCYYSESTKINGDKIYNYYHITEYNILHFRKIVSNLSALDTYNNYLVEMEDEDTIF